MAKPESLAWEALTRHLLERNLPVTPSRWEPETPLIATLDEEVHIGRCVRSIDGLGPVFVVDAGSSDETAEIARSSGATVVRHEWEGYSDQKNWALGSLPIATR